MMNTMKNVIEQEYDEHADGMNMNMHLENLATSMKMGNPDDANRVLRAIKRMGFQLPASVVDTGAPRGPTPRFATYVPPWKREELVGKKMTGAELEAAMAPVVEPVAEPVAEPVEEVAAAKAEEPVEPVEVVKTVAAVKTVAVAKRQVLKKVVPARTKEMKKLEKKLKVARALLDKDGRPLDGLNSDQVAKAESIGEMEQELARLIAEDAAYLQRMQRREQLSKERADAERVAAGVDGPIRKTPEKKKKTRREPTTQGAWKAGKASAEQDDAQESSDDDVAGWGKWAGLADGKTKPVVGGLSMKEAALREQENPVDGDGGDWTSTVKVKPRNIQKKQQYAHQGLVGKVTRWNGHNGHIMTQDLRANPRAWPSTGVYFELRDVSQSEGVQMGCQIQFDAINSDRGGLKAINCLVMYG
jgi:hypothetical protein